MFSVLPACPAPGRIPCSSGLLPAISKLKLLLCKCCCSCCHGTQNQAGKEQGSCSSKENTNQNLQRKSQLHQRKKKAIVKAEPGSSSSSKEVIQVTRGALSALITSLKHQTKAKKATEEHKAAAQKNPGRIFGCIHNITSNATSMAACLSQLRITSRAPQRGRTRFLQGCSNQECRTLPGTPIWNR